MGKASSSKKVERAARTGSTTSTQRLKLGFPAVVASVVILGVGLVAYARTNADSVVRVPGLTDHWHAAYGIYTCDAFIPPLVDQGQDAQGIHTHGDGLMHVHPFTTAVTGDRARLDRWAEQTGLVFGADSFTLPTGESFKNGQDCNGTPGEVVVARWDDARTVNDAEPDVLLRSDFADLRYVQNGSAILIAFLPEGAPLPRPDVSSLGEIGDLAPGEEAPFDPSELPPGTTSATTEPPRTSVPTSGAPSTTAGEGSATTVPATTTPVTSAPTTTAP